MPGFDLIFYGHDHRAKAAKVLNVQGDTVYVLNAGCRGNGLALAEVTLSQNEAPKVQIGLLPTQEQDPDPDYQALLQPYLDRAEAYQEQEVATLPVSISPEDVFLGSCLWVDEIHRCQFEEVASRGMPADISLVAALSHNSGLKKGTLKVKDFFKWYPFENSLAVMEMTGNDVRRHLEYSFEMRNTIYNYDCAAGIRYQVEKDKPYGERVTVFSMEDGTPFFLDSTYRVVLNSYRSMGGGNHFVNGCGWAQDDIQGHRIWNSEEDLRSLFIEWAKAKGTMDAEPIGNWKVL